MIERSQQDDVTVLRMAHGKASALDLEFLNGIRDAFVAERDASDGAVVLTGSGRIFSAGVDLFRILREGREYIEAFLPALDEMVLSIFDFPRPVVAAVNGHAIAGGCVLACACDHRLLVDGQATIGVPELRVGVPFPIIPLEMIERVLPRHRIEEVVWQGRTYDPASALELGLVHELVASEQMQERALDVARDLMTIPPSSFAATKERLHDRSHARFAAGGAASMKRMLELWSSGEVTSAIQAYVDKTIKKS
ncbi:MAG: enoyl-CoA hydratase [Planctomycetota bacterium]|jgi:enoyl-CoA hydratase